MNADVLVNLKSKFVNDFDKYMTKLHKGYQEDYTLLLYEICVINNPDYFNNNVYEYLMSYE